MENKYSRDVWNEYYKKEKKIHIRPKSGFFVSYDIFLCDSILEKYLPFNNGDKKNVKICEIGCGDGKLVKKISDNFNYNPFGIEYSEETADQAKNLGINVIKEDAFDKNMLEKYKGSFDIVYSYGFIEHIIPPEKAIDVHLKLLKPDGYFFIQIPRLKGFNYLKVKIFRPDLIPLHNFSIMEDNVLSGLCKRTDTKELFCKNYGTLKLRVPLAKKDLRWYILKIICLLEYILNPLFRILFREKGFETKLFSSSVIFVGQKI